MKLILKQDVKHLGDAGEVVDVKPGYARNYLLPHDLAYEASEANIRRLEDERRQEEERAKRDYLEARRRAAQLEGMVLVFEARASEEGRLFGSVTASDIAEKSNERDLDFEVDRRRVLLEEPIKSVGAFMVSVGLHEDVEVEIEVRVERSDE